MTRGEREGFLWLLWNDVMENCEHGEPWEEACGECGRESLWDRATKAETHKKGSEP